MSSNNNNSSSATLVPTLYDTEQISIYYDDDDEFFSDYETKTVNPNWEFTVVVIILCLLINLSLPLWLKSYDAIMKRLNERGGKNSDEENVTSNRIFNARGGGDDEDDTNPRKKQDTRDESVVDNVAGSILSAREATTSSVHSKNGVGHYHPYFHRPPTSPAPSNTKSAPDSVVSSQSSVKFTDAASAILLARPKRSNLPQQHRLKRKKKIRSGGADRHRLDVRIAAEYKVAEQALQRHANEDWGNSPSTATADDRSDFAPSIMSKLDEDAISVRDAVDAKDIGTVPLSKVDPTDDSRFTFDRLLHIADWDREMRRFVMLAVQFASQGVSIEFFQIVNVSVIGHFIGVREANAFVMVNILLEFTTTITKGFAECQYIRIAYIFNVLAPVLALYSHSKVCFYIVFLKPLQV
jgi:hypothetical protein